VSLEDQAVVSILRLTRRYRESVLTWSRIARSAFTEMTNPHVFSSEHTQHDLNP